MSYRCDCCNKNVAPNKKQNKRVSKTRNKSYQYGAEGWEIVKEEKLCGDCAKAFDETKTV